MIILLIISISVREILKNSDGENVTKYRYRRFILNSWQQKSKSMLSLSSSQFF